MPTSIRDLFSGQFDEVLLPAHEVGRLLRAHPNSATRWGIPITRTSRRGGHEYRVKDVADWLNNVGRGPVRKAA